MPISIAHIFFPKLNIISVEPPINLINRLWSLELGLMKSKYTLEIGVLSSAQIYPQNRPESIVPSLPPLYQTRTSRQTMIGTQIVCLNCAIYEMIKFCVSLEASGVDGKDCEESSWKKERSEGELSKVQFLINPIASCRCTRFWNRATNSHLIQPPALGSFMKEGSGEVSRNWKNSEEEDYLWDDASSRRVNPILTSSNSSKIDPRLYFDSERPGFENRQPSPDLPSTEQRIPSASLRAKGSFLLDENVHE
ncbi:unnamed protein product [Lactuca virosa]|uniref:Uncharacterized protein n=1 Tax=Lactuca virosa TaxID=75947 RepID=A0AAU9M119_9ASTR|nr:unnamed protein product [Lactuca virosa]